MLTPDALAVIERLFKAIIFVPTIALVGWWIFANWLDRTLTPGEAGVAFGILATAFTLGVISIITGGWGFLGIIALVYLAVVTLAAREYTDWRRREREHYLAQIEKCKQTIAKDASNAAAFSYMGEAYLRLGRFEEAQAALEKALELEPQSKRDQRLLRCARERRFTPWIRLD